MARPVPKRLTSEQKQKLKDPRYIIALRAVKPLLSTNKKNASTR